MNDCTYNTQCFELNENTSGNDDQIIEIEDNSTDEQTEDSDTLWSIDDDTFFEPLGLINHGNENKSVFVTWNENYLLNFVFKKSHKTGRTKLTKVRLDVQSEEIRQILILELNTLLLMQSGRVFHFSSVKTMHPVKWLTGVRAISSAAEGFSVIRLLVSDNTLHLEVYKDVMNMQLSESTLQQSYDITFDETNIFNCMWEDEHFTLHSQKVSDGNREFLGHLIGNPTQLHHQEGEIHFFTVSGSIYALIPHENTESDATTELPEYHIQICATYASNIEFIKILCDRKLCLIFLQCGTIEIWYMSELTQNLQRNTHITGTHFVHYEYANSNDCFYYTNEEQVAQLQFYYDSRSDNCHVLEKTKAVYGILACTWMQSIQQLICLSNNNIFYQLAFDDQIIPEEKDQTEFKESKVECENLNELYELTNAKMARLLEKANILEELQRIPTEIHQSIEQEFVKQELLAVSTKLHIYRKLFKVSLEFTKHLPMLQSNQNNLTYIYTSANCILNSNSLFALIYLKITKHDIFQASAWNICINYGENCIILNIPQSVFHNELCIVIPLLRLEQNLLPTFQLFLGAFVNIESDFVAISLPLQLQIECKSIIKLFTTQLACSTICTTHNIESLISTFNKKPTSSNTKDTKTLTCKLNLGKNNFNEIRKMFNETSSNNVDDALKIYFMSVSLKIAHNVSDNSICLECSDAAALYYAKYLILNKLDMVRVNSDLDESKKFIMQSQADIERCYGSLMDMDNEIMDTLHLENMLRIYTKLRAEFSKRYK